MATNDFNIKPGGQFNMDGAGNPYGFIFPEGSNLDADPVGCRNISAGPLTVTLFASAGQTFWRAGDTPVSQIEVTVQPTFSALYVSRNGQWVPYVSNQVADNLLRMQVAGYFGMNLTGAVGLDVPSLAWETLPYENSFPTDPYSPRGGTPDPATNTFVFDTAGIWQLMFVMNLQGFAGLNAARNFAVRPFNATKLEAGPETVIGVGRNVEDLLASFTVLIQIPPEDIGDEWRMEVGGNDAITGGFLINNDLFLAYQSELGPLVFDPGPPVFETQPQSQSITIGETATFITSVSGIPAPIFQWQVEDGTGWADIVGETSSILTFVTTADDANNQYRCIATNSEGTATSTVATLTLVPATGIKVPGVALKGYLYTKLDTTTSTFPISYECWVNHNPAAVTAEQVPFGMTSQTSNTVYFNFAFDNSTTPGEVKVTRRNIGQPIRTTVATGVVGWHKWKCTILSEFSFEVWQDDVSLGIFTEASVPFDSPVNQVNIGNLRYAAGQTGLEFDGSIALCKAWAGGVLIGQWDLDGSGQDSLSDDSQWLTEIADVEWLGTQFAVFNGTGSFIDFPNEVRDLLSVSLPWKVEFWWRKNDNVTRILLQQVITNNVDFWSFALNSGYSRTYIKISGSSNAASFAVRRSSQTWQKLEVTWDPNSQTFELNGQPSDGTLNASYASTGSVLRMGASQTGTASFNGEIRDFKVYDVTGTTLIAHYPLATDANDIGPNTYGPGTPTNIIWGSE